MLRKLLRALGLLALGGAAFAQTTTHAGVIKDLAGNVVTSGQVTFTLTPPTDSTIPGTRRFTPSTVPCNIRNDGTLSGLPSGPCLVASNTTLTPAGTAYRVCIQPYFPSPGSCFYDYAMTSSKDISTIAPTLSTRPINYGGVYGPQGPQGSGGIGCGVGKCLVGAPAVSQRVTQPAATTFAVNNFNSTYYVNGDGATDNTAEIQADVTACVASCRIVLVKTVIAGQINLPTTVDIKFNAVGPVSVTSTTNAFYRYMAGLGARVNNTIEFEGITFTKSNAGTIIFDNLYFNSGTNSGIFVHECNFLLSNASAVAIALSGDSGTVISGNSFNNPSASVSTATAINIVSDVVSGDITPRTPMVATIANNFFRYLTAIKYTINAPGADASEGFIMTGNHFVLASVQMSGNEFQAIGNEFVGANVTLKDLNNSSFIGNYLDGGNVPNQRLLTIDNVVHASISGNVFQAALQVNTVGVAFVNPRTLTTGTTNVTLTGNFYQGANKSNTNGGYGILFNDAIARNILVANESFRTLTSALEFQATLDRSTIDMFEARDIFYYAHNVAKYAGTYLLAPHLYAKIPIFIAGYVPAVLGGATNIASVEVFPDSMFPGFTQSITPGTCSKGASTVLGFSGNNARYVYLQVNASAPVGTATCEAVVTFNGSVYVAPR